jgi:hypothetical protein
MDKLTIVITDHTNLQYYRHPHNDEPTIALPANLFFAPNAPILNLKVLSRSVQNPTIRCCTIDLSMDPLEELVLTAQTNNESTLNQWRNAHGIEARPGRLWWKNKALVVVGNDDLKRGVLRHFHDHIVAGHPGITKTLTNVR